MTCFIENGNKYIFYILHNNHKTFNDFYKKKFKKKKHRMNIPQ